MKRARWPLVLVLVGCAGAHPKSEDAVRRKPPPPKSISTADKLFPDLQKQVELARGAPFTRPVVVWTYDAAGYRAYITEKVRAVPARRWEDERRVLRALDLVGDDVKELGAVAVEMLATQEAGFYDAGEDALIVPEAPAETDPVKAAQMKAVSESALANQLVHALTAQRLGAHILLRQAERMDLEEDPAEAVLMMAEGDAALATLHLTAPQLTAETGAAVFQAMRSTPRPGLEKVPPFFREVLTARYADGGAFCAAIHRAGGWQLLDKVYAAPPETTEQAMHPEKYLSGEPPVLVTLPDLDAMIRSRGYEKQSERTMGELVIRIWTSIYVTPSVGAEAAAGWSGDRLALYRSNRGAPDAVIWASAWDTESDAAELESAAVAAMASRGRQVKSGSCRVLERGDRADAICRAGRVVGIAREIPSDLAAHFGDALAHARLTERPARPPIAGVKASALGSLASATGRVDGLRYLDEAHHFAISRPADQAFSFLPGPTSGGEQVTPVIMASPGGLAQVRVTVFPGAAPLEALVAKLSRGYAAKLPGGEAQKPMALKRSDKREAWAAGFTSKAGSGRTIAIAGEKVTYALIAVWAPSAKPEVIQAAQKAMDTFEILR